MFQSGQGTTTMVTSYIIYYNWFWCLIQGTFLRLYMIICCVPLLVLRVLLLMTPIKSGWEKYQLPVMVWNWHTGRTRTHSYFNEMVSHACQASCIPQYTCQGLEETSGRGYLQRVTYKLLRTPVAQWECFGWYFGQFK